MEGLKIGTQQALPTINELILQHQKQKQKSDILGKILGVGAPSSQVDLGLESPMGEDASRGLEFTPEKIMALELAGEHQTAKTAAQIFQGQQKEREQTRKNKEEKKLSQDSFDQMSRLLHKGNLGLGSELKAKAIGGETAEDVGEFTSLLGKLEALLVEKVNRGTLSNTRFKYITEQLLPRAGDRDATIKGKMKGLARELGLDPKVLLKKEAPSSKEIGGEFVLMKDPQGVTRKVPRDQVEEAKKAGGTLIE